METNFKFFLEALSQALELSHLHPSTLGSCSVIAPGNLPLLFEWDSAIIPDTILVSLPLGPLRADQHDLVIAMLRANEDLASTLSLQQSDQMVFLHQRLSPTLSSSELKVALHQLLQDAKNWKQTLATHVGQETSTTHIAPIQFKA